MKCLRTIVNNPGAAEDFMAHPLILTQVASSLNSPHIPTRRLVLELLNFFTYYRDGESHDLVVAALETLSTANGEGHSPYDYWFKSLEQALSGRGKMGSLVGASEEVKRAAGIEQNLNEYAVRIFRSAYPTNSAEFWDIAL